MPSEPTELPLPALVDLDVWLRSLTRQLTRVEAELPAAISQAPPGTSAAGTTRSGHGDRGAP
ncbi:hypothetical protein [Streptomyces sp. NPDC056464]